jgi:hypothetical protein
MDLFFDECMPPKWFKLLDELLTNKKKPAKSFHLLDHLKSGEKDDTIVEWLTHQDPPLMVISADSGVHSKRGDPRMHRLCPAMKITSVFLSRKSCQVEGFEKVRMVMECIPELEDAYNGPRGDRYKIERRGKNIIGYGSGRCRHVAAW